MPGPPPRTLPCHPGHRSQGFGMDGAFGASSDGDHGDGRPPRASAFPSVTWGAAKSLWPQPPHPDSPSRTYRGSPGLRPAQRAPASPCGGLPARRPGEEDQFQDDLGDFSPCLSQPAAPLREASPWQSPQGRCCRWGAGQVGVAGPSGHKGAEAPAFRSTSRRGTWTRPQRGQRASPWSWLALRPLPQPLLESLLKLCRRPLV